MLPFAMTSKPKRSPNERHIFSWLGADHRLRVLGALLGFCVGGNVVIRSSEQLHSVLAGGGAISLQPPFEGNGPLVLCVNSTGEIVHRQALNTLMKRGKITVAGHDLLGDPTDFVLAESAE